MDNKEFFVRCAGGFESLLSDELKNLGIKRVRPLNGGVAFFGSIEQAYRSCLWSRTASRVLLIIDRVAAHDADELYQGIHTIVWEDHIGPHASIAVYARGVNDALRNTQFSAVKVKDAICDRLREKRGFRPDVRTARPDVLIDISIRKDRATVAIDLSGDPLHRRGYREAGKQSVAPLKENLAAALILQSGWQDIMAPDAVFIDPLCGSGTLAIEAAMIAADEAPGILRDHWGFSGWEQHDADLWDALIEEADRRFAKGLSRMPQIFASDIDPVSVELAEKNAKRAGLLDHIDFKVADVSQMGSIFSAEASTGLLVTNPPYGERLGSPHELKKLYESLAQGLEGLPEGWRISIITPDEGIDEALKRAPDACKPFYNGRIETQLRSYATGHDSCVHIEVVSPSTGTTMSLAVNEKNSEQFSSRLKKVAKERRKWARKNDVSCYRIYDSDLPDYAVAIDVYEGFGTFADKSFLHIAEYRAPQTIDEDRARRRFLDVLTVAPVVLGIPSDQVFYKVRRREKGGGQYREDKRDAFTVLTKEAGYTFEIDLAGHLDTGIFLDHRMTREMIGNMASGKRFLNLFCYTGAATVHAAGGKAVTTTSVDLSQTYLSWAKRNMAHNGFTGDAHRYVRADVLTWLDEAAQAGERYDLIFIDPPTFSNSKSMGDASWSVQRDHLSLLTKAVALLSPEGRAVFSCNLRNFKPDLEGLDKASITLEDISLATIPEDFKRNQKIHKCYYVQRGQSPMHISP